MLLDVWLGQRPHSSFSAAATARATVNNVADIIGVAIGQEEIRRKPHWIRISQKEATRLRSSRSRRNRIRGSLRQMTSSAATEHMRTETAILVGCIEAECGSSFKLDQDGKEGHAYEWTPPPSTGGATDIT